MAKVYGREIDLDCECIPVCESIQINVHISMITDEVIDFQANWVSSSVKEKFESFLSYAFYFCLVASKSK